MGLSSLSQTVDFRNESDRLIQQVESNEEEMKIM